MSTNTVETVDMSACVITRDIQIGGGLPGHQELAEDLSRRGFDPSAYPPQVQAGLKEARARGLSGNPREASLFAVAFAEAARMVMGREQSALLDAAAARGREAAQERKRQEAVGRACAVREAARLAAEGRARAMQEALEAIRCAHFRVPEDQRDDVARIMIERGLSASEAFDAFLDEAEPSPCHAGHLGGTAR